jgi:aspartyl-tRNA(Asn)/glutamyl-tRNA(Gln) amidotransferase subunit C
MAGTIDAATVRHIAHLSRLNLTDAEVERFTGQLADFLQYAEQLDAVNIEGVAPTAHPLPLHNVLRDDVPHEPLGADAVLANAPRVEADHFALPKVLDQESA